MKKWNLVTLLACITIVLNACGGGNHGNEVQGQEESYLDLVILDVAISTDPEQVEPNQPVTVSATVQLEGEPIEDADEVEFEIWKQGQDDHEYIPATHQEGGIYSIEYTFKEEAVYNVIAHVTARDSHRMPKQEIIVGHPNAAAEDES